MNFSLFCLQHTQYGGLENPSLITCTADDTAHATILMHLDNINAASE